MEFSILQQRLGYTFKDPSLLELALIHRSFFHEQEKELAGHNERLEFLGDAVLGLLVSSYLYTHLPRAAEGHLSHLKAHLACSDFCAECLSLLGIEEYLLLGKGEAANVGRGRKRLLANLFEAVIGAIYLDGGFSAVEAFFFSHFKETFEQAIASPLRNWKADLQDWAQKKTQKPPQYLLIEEAGPPHKRVFTVAVMVEQKEIGRGKGCSKKEAEAAAAQDALGQIEGEEHG